MRKGKTDNHPDSTPTRLPPQTQRRTCEPETKPLACLGASSRLAPNLVVDARQTIEQGHGVTVQTDPPGQLDRTPPQDLAAEQSVLGAMMMSKDAIADVVELVRGVDFYKPAHELIFDAILDLYNRGEPADAITVADELTKQGQIAKVGSHVYLHDLLSPVSIAANATYYAQIVREKAILRRLVEASIKIAQMSYSEQGEVDDIVDAAQQTLYEVGQGRVSEDYKPLSALVESTIDEMETLSESKNKLSGVPTGFRDLDELTNGLHPGQMIIVAARPGLGKSTLALDFARSAAIRNGLCAAFFSLEMSQSEIVMRLYSAEAHVRLNKIRRFTEPDHDGDSSEGAASETTPRPAAGSHRLHSADDFGQEGGESTTGSVRVLQANQASGQGIGHSGGGPLSVEPGGRNTNRQEACARGPSRIRVFGAGRRLGHLAASRRHVQT